MKLIFFLPLAGMLLILIYRKVSKKAMKGMNLVFNVGHGEEDSIPLTLVPLSIIGTWMTHLFGGSAGREGVAVQIGATVSHYIGSRIKIENGSRFCRIVWDTNCSMFFFFGSFDCRCT